MDKHEAQVVSEPHQTDGFIGAAKQEKKSTKSLPRSHSKRNSHNDSDHQGGSAVAGMANQEAITKSSLPYRNSSRSGQLLIANQVTGATAGTAAATLKPIQMKLSHKSKRSRQTVVVTQARHTAVEMLSMAVAKPIRELATSPISKSSRHGKRVTHVGRATTEAPNENVQTMPRAALPNSNGPGGSETQTTQAVHGEAIRTTEPMRTPLRRSSRRIIGRKRHFDSDNPPNPALASDNGSQFSGANQLDDAAVSHSSNGRQKRCDNQNRSATDALSDVQSALHPQDEGDIAGGAHCLLDTQKTSGIPTIVELWRRRQAWHRAEKSLTLQAKAICRRYVGGDKDEADKLFGKLEDTPPITEAGIAIYPLLLARTNLAQHRSAIEKELTKSAKVLPIYEWAKGIRGLGALSVAAMVGECGNIGSYKSVSAVWKRFGLAVIGGGRQRKVTGPDALLHGYSPGRRSVAWNIGVSLMRAQKPDDPYRAFYDLEKARQLAKELPLGHAHNRACRHMTKRLLRDLYVAWNKADSAKGSAITNLHLHDAVDKEELAQPAKL